MGMMLLSTAVTLLVTAMAMNPAQRRCEPAAAGSSCQVFVTYCASCHGVNGRGDGPAAGEFGPPPADLTQLAKQNGGVFDGAKIHGIIDGRSVKAHGTMEMLVWGDAFRCREGLPDDALRGRIDALVLYLESLQERAGH